MHDTLKFVIRLLTDQYGECFPFHKMVNDLDYNLCWRDVKTILSYEEAKTLYLDLSRYNPDYRYLMEPCPSAPPSTK
jgi:hypothetical protein